MTPVRRAILLALSSLVLGSLAAQAVNGREEELRSRVGDPVPVLVTARSMPAGTRLAPGLLAVRAVPRRWAPVDGVGDPERLDGMVTTVELPAGAFLTAGAWRDPGEGGAGELAADERVATVVAVAPPGTVRPGIRVDVVVARSGARPVVALRSVQVMAVRVPPGDSDQAGGHTVEADLRTRIDGALKLAQAAGEGAEVRLLPIGGGEG